ncbi:hypothetical protein ABZ799_01470 [Nocardiopsis dassonvillei]|uniref:hypothetical protein n=1 Tax=Nocardiopsis dassonvillei TaxID=2014 RepID=UPI0033D48C7C
MIRRHTCFIAECDTPDCEPFDDHDYIPHFDSAEEAVSRLVDEWGWTNNGALLCPADSARRECEQTGHQWQRWSSDPGVGVTEEGCGRCDTTRLVSTPA